MAKKTKVVKEVKVANITLDPIVNETTETLKTLPVIESEFEEVTNIVSAEGLQKSGRQLISVSTINGVKTYKFKR